MRPLVKPRVYAYLESVDRPVTIDEIAEETGVCRTTVKRVKREIVESGGPVWKFGKKQRSHWGRSGEQRDKVLRFVYILGPVTCPEIMSGTHVASAPQILSKLHKAGIITKKLIFSDGNLKVHYSVVRGYNPPRPNPTPAITCQDMILNYVRQSETPVTYADIQQGTGVHRNTVSWVVGNLYGAGLLQKMLRVAEPGGGLRPHFYIER